MFGLAFAESVHISPPTFSFASSPRQQHPFSALSSSPVHPNQTVLDFGQAFHQTSVSPILTTAVLALATAFLLYALLYTHSQRLPKWFKKLVASHATPTIIRKVSSRLPSHGQDIV
jgi:hypothetical protein